MYFLRLIINLTEKNTARRTNSVLILCIGSLLFFKHIFNTYFSLCRMQYYMPTAGPMSIWIPPRRLSKVWMRARSMRSKCSNHLKFVLKNVVRILLVNLRRNQFCSAIYLPLAAKCSNKQNISAFFTLNWFIIIDLNR